MLDRILSEVDRVSSALMAAQGRTGQNVRDNEWLMSIRGRTIIPGGACEFDLPSYYAWQHRPAAERLADISNGLRRWRPCSTPLPSCCGCCANRARPSRSIAQGGSYQQMLQGKVYQMLRLTLDPTLGAIPEISANKYMLWVRFTSQDGDMKPKAYDGEVPFELTLCNF